MIKISNIKIPVDSDISVSEKVSKILKTNRFGDVKIIKQSLDARKKGELYFVYSVAVTAENEEKTVAALNNKDVVYAPEKSEVPLEYGDKKLETRPVIAGSGPAGLFCAYTLAKYGFRPIILERGADVDSRVKAVEGFFGGGMLDTRSNVQFGEGGAGTFSDGKLTTRINDIRCESVLKTFVKCGAPGEILYRAKPHIGTDILRSVVKNMRNEIIRLGGEVIFNSKLTDIKADGAIKSVVAENGEYPCEILVLAIGHSARDTFSMLTEKGVKMQAKSFSVGVRIEHLQSEIDKGMYGGFAGHEKLPPAQYQLWNKADGRCCYSFCMCPGGTVVAAASEEGGVVTNGMSCHARAGKNANSALVVDVHPTDFDGILGGIEFQRRLEGTAFSAGGGSYFAPMQSVGGFLHGKNGAVIEPTYKPGVTPCDLKEILPDFVSKSLAAGLFAFERKIRGFACDSAVMTGVETRTSSPIRIVRGENLQSESIKGLYPCGEGAGYAGGIMSAAVDGIKVAEKIISEYKI